MDQKLKYRLVKTTVIFWLLLLYIVAALIWWFISLEKQNEIIYQSKLNELKITIQKNDAPQEYNNMIAKLNDARSRNQAKYAGEGIVFLFFIMGGAYFIIRSIRQQIKMQQQQENFMMAVTHELKTPIAVAKLNLETLLKYDLDEDKKAKLTQTTLDETKRLDFLTNNILTSSQIENRNYRVNREDLDLSHLLHDRVSEFRKRFRDRTFTEEIDEDTDVIGDSLLLQIMINNLLENAVKYSEKASAITAVLKNEAGYVILRIADNGLGIPDDEKPKIFAKFYRPGVEATRRTKGTGLGLFLCKKIATDLGGTILVKDNFPKGSIFEVTFRK